MNESTDKEKEVEENNRPTPTPGNRSQQPDAMPVPGIFISHFDSSDVDECDGGSLVYDDEPRERCETYSAGGARCMLTVRRADGGRGSSCSSSAGLFASQRSLPWSSKCSSRLGVCDSGWDGDVSHDGSMSTISHRDWTALPSSDAARRGVMTSASMNLFPPFSLQRRHSASTAEQKLGKTSTTACDDESDSAAQRDGDCTTCYHLSVKSEMIGPSSGDDDETERQSLHVGRSQVPGVHLGISSSRSLTGIESAVLKVTIDDTDSNKVAIYRHRSMTTPIKRRALRQKKAVNNRRAEMTTIWINHHQHTDDSEVERRVERLLYEIDHSVTQRLTTASPRD